MQVNKTQMRVIINFVIYVRPSFRLSRWNQLATTGRIFMKYDTLGFFETMSRNSNLIKIWLE